MVESHTFQIKYSLPIKDVFLQISIKDGIITFADYQTGIVSSQDNNIFQNSLAQKIKNDIDAYIKNPQHHFTVKMDLTNRGTVFQKKIWGILQKIPVGKTLTYSEVAKLTASSPRAVGNACGANHLPLFIPCHRVVAKNSLGGFSHQRNGKMLEVKSWLLQHEGIEL